MNIPEYREFKTVRDSNDPSMQPGLSFGVWLLLLVAFCVLVPLARCQSDIISSRPDQDYLVIARGAQWGVSGSGSGDCSIRTSACGVNNNFIFPARFAQESVTVYVFNNSLTTNQTALTFQASATSDPAVINFQNNTAKWSLLALNLNGGLINSVTSAQAIFQSSGAARIALTFGGGQVAGDTLGADIVVVQSQISGASSSLISSSVGTLVNGLFPANSTAIVLANLNPLVGGCRVSPAGTSGGGGSRSQFLNCDVNGNLSVVNPVGGSLTINFSSVASDPCQNPNVAKSSAVVTVGAATTLQIVGLVAGQQIFVCGYQISQAVLAGTLQWTSGTGVNCAATVVTKTGAMQTIVGQPFIYSTGGTVFTVASGSELCLTTTGAGATAAGVVSFVQQ